jgi:prolyl-tRNA synthetase
MLYQFGTKFRDEIRPRFGVMRSREFYMKDAYSFHTDEKDLERYYERAFNAYKKICDRCGFVYRPVEAMSGAIGGSYSHEFMVLAETGEEVIAWCECGYGANLEKAECRTETCPPRDRSLEKEPKEIATPNMRTVDEVGKFLGRGIEQFIKTLVYVADGAPVVVLIRGDYEVNEAKLQSVLEAGEIRLADEATIEAVTGAPLGFAGPAGLKGKVKIIADLSIAAMANAVSGANRKDYHLENVNIGRDFTPDAVIDIRKVHEGDLCPHCGKPLRFSRGIEIGHAFKLGTKYSKSMRAVYLDADGKEQTMVMGCYGIGVSRIVAATIEQSHDDNGIVWPAPLAPFEVVIVPVNWAEEKTRAVSETIYRALQDAGYDVLLDDRDERAGIKFKDADLIGIPYRITVGEKNLKDNKVEFKARQEKTAESRLLPVEAVLEEVRSRLTGR